MSTDMADRVSVVIPALNEERNIGSLLQAMSAQTLLPDEVIVVDAGSTDRTQEIAGREGSGLRCFRLVESPGAYPGRARNVGVQLTHYEWVLFIDCGIAIEADCIHNLMQTAQADGAEVVFGHVVAETSSLFTECSVAVYLPPVRFQGKTLPRLTAQLLLIRRSTFEATGGFPEELRAAEDLIFLKALDDLGFKKSVALNAMGHWQLAPDAISLLRRFRCYSRHNIQAGLWLHWQLRLGVYYVVALFTTFLVLLLATSPPLALLPLVLFYIARAAKSLWVHREDLPAPLWKQLARFVFAGPIIVLIDAATFLGFVDFVLSRPHVEQVPSVVTQKSPLSRQL